LEQRVKEGAFREDLFHRLNVIRLRLPALRERREDVLVLTKHFLVQSAQQLGVEPKRISDPALEILSHFHFPGNVRQLENICHWLTVMAPAQMIETKDLPPEVLAAPVGSVTPIAQSASVDTSAVRELGSASMVATPAPALINLGAHAGWESALEVEAMQLLGTDRQDVWDVLSKRFESLLIQAALATTRGRRIEAAVKLGIGRNTITRKIQELKIEG
jgi:two-component system nitrogen regulation response regulator GlnG